MSANFTQEFEAMRKLRGKKRAAAIEELTKKGEDILEGLLDLFLDTNKSRRELAVKIFNDIEVKREESFEAISETIEELLENSKASVRVYGLDLVEKFAENLSTLSEVLVPFVQTEQQEPHLSRGLTFLKGCQLDKEALTKALDPVLDSWSPEARGLACEMLEGCGVTPRESVWKDAPLHPEVIKQIQRLGGRCLKAYDGSEEKRYKWAEHFNSWDGAENSGLKPKTKSFKFPKTPWFFDRHVELAGTYTHFDHSRASEIVFGKPEYLDNVDVVERGERLLLYVIAVDNAQRYAYSLDLMGPKKDTNPRVIYQDLTARDIGTEAIELSKFLGALKVMDNE